MSDPQMSLSEAVLAMLAMIIVLIFVLFYYCILPCYHNYKKHNWTRSHDGEDWEEDPRWNNHKFLFAPKKPTDYLTDKKYSRLGACSRTSSMRSNNPLVDGAQDISGTPSSNLDVEAAQPAIAPLSGTTVPKQKPQKPPKYSDIYNANGKCGSSGSVSSSNTSSRSNPPEYASKTPSVEMNLNQEQQKPKDQSQVTSPTGATKAAPTKVKIMKPPKKNRKPVTPDNVPKTTECTNETQGEAT